MNNLTSSELEQVHLAMLSREADLLVMIEAYQDDKLFQKGLQLDLLVTQGVLHRIYDEKDLESLAS